MNERTGGTAGRRFRIFALGSVIAGLLLLAMLPSPSSAGHDMGFQCYLCHNLSGGSLWPSSYAIYSGNPIGMSPSQNRPITCDYCHTDYAPKFSVSYRSKHPVRIIGGATTSPDNSWGTVYGSLPAYIDCRDCHKGNVTTASPDLSPDVSPTHYLSLGGNGPLDGYPNHDNTIVGDNVVAAVPDSQNVWTEPPVATEPHLDNTYLKRPSSSPGTAYAFCFGCHDGSAGKTNRMANVRNDYVNGSGHYYKSAGNPTGGVVGDRMPCSDCHVSHNSTSSRLYLSPRSPRSTIVFTNPASPTGTEIRSMCNDCHADQGSPGAFTAATPTVRGKRPLVRPYPGVAEHDNASAVSCTTSLCHKAHDAPAQCNDCHGSASGGSGMGAPPDSPKSGSILWSSSVDRVGQPLTQGLHRVVSSDNAMRTDHDAYSCSECHTPTPGSGATHLDNGVNATMDNLSWRGATFTPRTAGKTGSVVDDSCNNVNCHSPYWNGNAGKSGTPFAYERYWENYSRWDCYTCHGYKDSDAATDNTNNPGNLDRHINTGAHDRHTRTTAKGGLGYDCVRCHATGNTTLYSAVLPGSDNTYPGTHKSGFVDWTFAGSPNPYGVAGNKRTYLGSDNGGTLAPTDNGSSHRLYGSCANLYCHSIGQTATGGTLTVDNTQQYRPPKWDNTFGGKCGDCHGGNGVTDNASSRIASGSHTQHVNSAPYAYPCGTCHSGLGRGVASHADNQVDLNITDNLSGTMVSATYSQGNRHNAGNGFGQCTNAYCHGTDNNVTLRLSGGANQAGSPNLPTWDNAQTAQCGSCHGAPGATGNYNPATYVGTQNWPGGAHARHVSGTDNQGPSPALACPDCHTANTASTHVDGKVDFRTAWNDNTTTTKAGTHVCDPCHGTGVSAAKSNWDNTSYLLDCLTCHGAVRAAAHADNTGWIAPNVAGDNSTYGSMVRGHNRPVGNYPVTGNPPANKACESCHSRSLLHINNAADNTYSGNRLLDNVLINASGPTYVGNITTVRGLCEACHSNAGSAAGKSAVNTHGNAGYADNLEGGNFQLSCNQCHEPHGMVLSPAGPNLWMINPSIQVNGATRVDNVSFTSRTGANSFNATKGTGFLTGYGAIKELCVACHANAANPGQPMTYNVAGWHNAPSYKGDETGKDCSGCHSHNQDGVRSTVDGLMPLACNACHSYPGLDNAASPKQMSRGHWDHVGQPGAGGTANSREYECTLCHFNFNHNQTGVTKGVAWPAYYVDNVNIRFDNTWNPGSPTYAGNPAGAVSAPGVGGAGVCAGLYCHGDGSRAAGWNGSLNQPRWDNVNGAPCGSCHDTGTGDATPGTSLSTKNHPAHLSAAYGPGLSAFDNNGNCSLGQGCHTKYGLTPTTFHLNNQVDLRSTATDNGEVGAFLNQVPATAVCRNCHSLYASSAGVGDSLVRTQVNWDNASYKVACVTCHNDAPSGNTPPNTRGTQTIGGGGHQAPNVEAAYFTSGHGAAGAPPAGIDNASTTTDSGLLDQVPPVRCETCHDEAGAHIGTSKDLTNPWRLDNAVTKYAQNGGLDNDCLRRCHSQTAFPPRHAWIVSGIGASAKDTTFQTHPTSTAVVPSGKGRWFLVPSDNVMPVLADLASKSPPARDNGSILLCVTCHDPHGVGTATLPATMRTFSGANTEAAGSKSMLRYNYSDNGVGNTALCTKCHK